MKNTLLLGFLLLLPCLNCTAQNSNMLAPYQWENRILLLFSPSETTGLYENQFKEFYAEKNGLKERDLVIFHFLNDKIITPKTRLPSTIEANKMRTTYQVKSNDVVVILIGKDGSEKLRKTNEILKTSELFAIIDAMPMRKAEMKRQKN